MKIFKVNGIPFTISKGSILCLEPVCLDIETSNNHAEKPEDLRTWIVSIQVYFNNEYYLFRTPEELVKWFNKIYKRLKLYPTSKYKKKLIIYIHNASYDLSYLLPYINLLPDFGYSNQGIIEGPNKILTYVRGSLEFRCSYLLTSMSLEKWSKEMNVEHKKQVGLYDYDAIIYPDTKLSDNQKIYDKYDVLSMRECLEKQMQYHNDTLATIPLTSTGYVRRNLRKSCRKDKYYRNEFFYDNRLNPDLFTYYLRSYAGGITHNNRFYKDIVVKIGEKYTYIDGTEIKVNNIGHRDFKSHYPTQMTCYLFPLGIPQLIYKNDMDFAMTIDTILSWYPQFSSMCVIRFYEANLKDIRISMPFMQHSKCYETHFIRNILDNGRIISAKGEWIMYVDNLTLDILNEQYELDYEILEVYRMINKPLPDCITSVVDKYFKGKSDKKNLVNELIEELGKLDPKTTEAEFDLMQDKKLLNAIYGCTATNPLRDKIEITEDIEYRYIQTYSNIDDISEGLKAYYNGRNNYLAYQVGCTVTALARHELYEYIKVIGYEKCLYCDTDSIFYIKDDKTEKAIESLNAEKKKKAHKVILDNDKEEYYDCFGPEPDCLAFKGLHSKCYGVVTDKGLELTIAGIPAKTLIDKYEDLPIYYTREYELAGINPKRVIQANIIAKKLNKDLKIKIRKPIEALNKLSDGFTFTINTGVSAIYIGATGYNTKREITHINIDGHEISTAGGCVIRKLKSKVVHDIDYNISFDEKIIQDYEIESIQ